MNGLTGFNHTLFEMCSPEETLCLSWRKYGLIPEEDIFLTSSEIGVPL